jgi:VanZ family protein
LRRALLLVILLIVYGCLYPFRFHPLPPDILSVFLQSWPAGLGRSTLRDAAVNVLLYVPLGLFAVLALDRIERAWLRLLMPLLLGMSLSMSIELLQLMDLTRTPSVFDVLCNTTGTAIGVATGRAYANRISGFVERTRHGLAGAPSASLLYCLWVLYQVFPLIPSLSRYGILTQLNVFFAQLSFSIPETLRSGMECLAMGALLERITGHRHIRRWMFGFLLLLPARLLLFHRRLSLPELTGAAIAYVFWTSGLNRWPKAAWMLSRLMLLSLLLEGLAPYRFSSIPQAFSWFPLAALLETGPDAGVLVLLRKSFWYGSAIWMLRESGYSFLRPGITVAVILGGVEWIQRYLPGRTPEITDPLLAILLALFMWLLEQRGSELAERSSQP